MSELHLNKKKQKKSEFGRLGRNGLVVLILLFGTVVLCAFLNLMQNRASERQQRSSMEKILQEVSESIRIDSGTADAITDVFHKMHQTSVNTLVNYINHQDVLAPLQQSVREGNRKKIASLQQNLSSLFVKVRDQIGAENIYLIDESGLIIVSSSPEAISTNLTATVTAAELAALTRYEMNPDGTGRNGTQRIDSDGTVIYTPVADGEDFLYSYMLTNRDGVNYFIAVSESSQLLKLELDAIKDMAQILDDVDIGESGFAFAVNPDTGDFLFYDDGQNTLTGQSFRDCGITDDITKEGYVGYQTINGVRYFCMSAEPVSYSGQDCIIVAAISRSELTDNNFSTVAIACMTFAVVAFTVIAYGLILREEMAYHLIQTEDDLEEALSDQVLGGKVKFTEEEIHERVHLKLVDIVARQTDKRFSRINIGTRNARGVQHYLSTYMLGKMVPIVGIGLVLIFITSFFSQTLLALGDVTSVTHSRLSEIQRDLDLNNSAASTISYYVDRQNLYKVNLIANLVEEMHGDIFSFTPESDNVHPVFDTVDGKKMPRTDSYGNPLYSSAFNSTLQYLCEDNAVLAISLLDESGQTIATSTDLWYSRLPHTPDSPTYPFTRILNGEMDSYVPGTATKGDSGHLQQYIGVAHYYYTFQNADGTSGYADLHAYQQQREGTWAGPTITRHRGLLQVCVDETQLEQLSKTTSLEYVLSNMHAYGGDSFLVAMDNSDEHIVLYSPISASIGMSAESIGISPSAFPLSGVYNGFQTVNGVDYYLCFTLVGDHFIATAVPTQSIYTARNQISTVTTVVSTIFIFLSSVMFSLSSDVADEKYCIQLRRIMQERKNNVAFGSSMSRGLYSSGGGSYRSAWSQKTPEQRLRFIIMVQLTIFSASLAVIVFSALTNGNSASIFSYIFSRAWERGINVFSMTESMMIMLLIYTGTKLTQMFVRAFCNSLGARVATTGDLVISVLRYGGILGGFFYCLYLFGLDTASLLTSAGILSVVLGLGAQSLISDIVAGVFIVFEGEFRVGDIVTIGDFRGTVQEIGLRTTKIIDLEKNVKIFNNSSISGVVNMTKESSVAVVDFGIEYGESLERVEAILKKGFPVIRRNLPAIVEGPFYKGVASLGDSSVNIRIVAMCSEHDRVQLIRDLNREIFLLFGRNDVNIPFPQVTLSYLKESEKSASAAEKQAAAGFVQEQKQLLEALDNEEEN